LNTKDKNIMDARNAEMLEGVIMDAGTRLELQHRVDGMLHEQEALLPDGSSESSGPLDEGREEEWQSMEALMQQRADKVAHRAERRTAQPPPAASMDEDQELETAQSALQNMKVDKTILPQGGVAMDERQVVEARKAAIMREQAILSQEQRAVREAESYEESRTWVGEVKPPRQTRREKETADMQEAYVQGGLHVGTDEVLPSIFPAICLEDMYRHDGTLDGGHKLVLNLWKRISLRSCDETWAYVQ
ncbi:hypothetical protein CYMTET_29316, partial [Cymbomonas tetramitiformis]